MLRVGIPVVVVQVAVHTWYPLRLPSHLEADVPDTFERRQGYQTIRLLIEHTIPAPSQVEIECIMGLLRPIGLNEKRCIVREDLKLYNNIVTVATYTGRRAPSEQEIFDAVVACLFEHPALSIVVDEAVKDKDPELLWQRATDVSKHVSFELDRDFSDLESALSKIHNEPLMNDSLVPQWRLFVLTPKPDDVFQTKFHAAFACSHALMDGMSGYAFHRTFLRALRNPAAGAEESSVAFKVPDGLSLLPTMDSHLSISWSFLLGPVIKEYFPTPLARMLGFNSETSATNAWLGASSRPDLTANSKFPPTSVHIASIPPDTLSQLLAHCRLHSTRLTALLHHLFARALARSLEKRGQDQKTFISSTAIDLRRALKQGENQMANYVSATNETITVDTPISSESGLSAAEWDSARRLTEKLAHASSTCSDHAVGLLKFLSNFKAWTIRNSKSPAEVSFEISNLGVFDDSNKSAGNEGFQVEDMLFSQSANGTGPPFSVNIASAKGGLLMMSVTWWNGMLGVEDEKSFIEEICQYVVSEAEAIAKQ